MSEDGNGAKDPKPDVDALMKAVRRLKRHYIFISICAGLATLIAIIQLIQDY